MTMGTGAPLARHKEWLAGREVGDRADARGRRSDTVGKPVDGLRGRGQWSGGGSGRQWDSIKKRWEPSGRSGPGRMERLGVATEAGVHARTRGEGSRSASDADGGGKEKDVTSGTVASAMQREAVASAK